MAHASVWSHTDCRLVRQGISRVSLSLVVAMMAEWAWGQEVKPAPGTVVSKAESLARYVPLRDLGSNRPDIVLAVLDGKAPSAVSHTRRTALFLPRDDFQPVAAGFLDMNELPPLPREAVQLGVDGLKRVELQWGFQDDALVSVLGVVAPEPRQGILALLDQPTFSIRSLPPLPAGLSGFTALSINPLETHDQIVSLMKKANPVGADQVPTFEEMIRQQFGLDLSHDLLPGLGPKLAFYVQPPALAAGRDPATAVLSQFTGLTFAAQVRDQAALTRSIDPLVRTINAIFEAQRGGPNAPGFAFRKQDSVPPTCWIYPMAPVAPQIAAMFQPTLTLGKDQLVLAATTAAAERAIGTATAGKHGASERQ